MNAASRMDSMQHFYAVRTMVGYGLCLAASLGLFLVAVLP